MDPLLIRQFTDALLTPHRTEAPEEFLRLAERLHGLTKDLREPIAYVTTEKLFPTNDSLLHAYAPHRKDASQEQAVADRVRNMARSFGTPSSNTFAMYPEVFDLVAAILFRLQGGPMEWKAPADLADVSVCYAHAITHAEARRPLADWLYTGRGELSSPAVRVLGPPAPSWLGEKLDRVVDNLKPQPVVRRRWLSVVRDRIHRTWNEVRQLEPSFLMVLAASLLATMLFAVSLFARPRNHEFRPEVPASPPAAAVPSATSIYELLTTRLKAKQDLFAGSVLLVAPRSRDNGDIRLAEAITAADMRDATVVPWHETRQVFGPDAPPFGRRWATSAELSQVLGPTLGDPKADSGQPPAPPPAPAPAPRVFFVDLEVEGPDLARVSIISADSKPGVVLIVRGPASNLARPLGSGEFIDRAMAQSANPSAPLVPRLLRQAQAAAENDAELAQVELTQALVQFANGNRAEAENAARQAWQWLTDADKQRLPDPLRWKIAAEMRSLEERARDQIEAKK